MQLGENEPVKMTMKTLLFILGGAATVTAAAVRWEIKLQAVQDEGTQHTQQLKDIASWQSDNHDTLAQLKATQHAQSALLNYIALGRHGDPPPKADEGSH